MTTQRGWVSTSTRGLLGRLVHVTLGASLALVAPPSTEAQVQAPAVGCSNVGLASSHPPGLLLDPTAILGSGAARALAFVKDRQAARRVGEALFWDPQAGPCGRSCASCHLRADVRAGDPSGRHRVLPRLLGAGAGDGGRSPGSEDAGRGSGPGPIALLVESVPGGAPALVAVAFRDASPAPEATGPLESGSGWTTDLRRWASIARELLARTIPPAGRPVAVEDGPLGPLSNQDAPQGTPGVDARYAELVQQAFDRSWWDAPGWLVDVGAGVPELVHGASTGPDVFTVMEYNFALLFGLAVREYMEALPAEDATPASPPPVASPPSPSSTPDVPATDGASVATDLPGTPVLAVLEPRAAGSSGGCGSAGVAALPSLLLVGLALLLRRSSRCVPARCGEGVGDPSPPLTKPALTLGTSHFE